MNTENTENTENTQNADKLMWYTLAVTFTATVIMLGVIIAYMEKKEIIYAKGMGISYEDTAKAIEFQQTQKEIIVENKPIEGADISIPLGNYITENRIKIENDYRRQMLYINIEGSPQGFYSQKKVLESTSLVHAAYYKESMEATQIALLLNSVYEYTVILKNNTLYLEFLKPKEVYEKIVVIDSEYWLEGETQRDKRETIRYIISGLEEKCKGIQFYITCPLEKDKVDQNQKKRIGLANDMQADMFISLEFLEEEKEVFGIRSLYHSEYFIPEFSSITLADVMERSVVNATKTQALGLFEVEKEDILLQEAMVPAVRIQLGNFEHKLEGKLLKNKEYLNRIVDGIATGIQESYQMIE